MNIPRNSRRRKPSGTPDFAFSPMSPDLDDDSPLARHHLQSSGSDFSNGPVDIGPQEIKKGKLLGKGSFAQVYAGMCRGLPVAVKVLNESLSVNEQGLRKFKDEIAVHQRLYHPNIVLLMGACVTDSHFMIVQELMYRDLERVLYDDTIKLSLCRRVEFGKQIALGMNWLHKLDPPVLHRDLKPSNCLLDRELVHLKIADFGLSSILLNKPSALKDSYGPRGTVNYLAPEVLSGNQLSTAADVFSYGVMLWQILTRRKPYEDLGSVSIDGFTDLIVDEEVRPELDAELCRDYPIVTELIERCWRAEADDRPNFSEICETMTDALIEIAIPHDSDAQSFWHKFFPSAGPEGVKIERLIKAMLKWFRLPANPEMRSEKLQRQLQQMELLLVEKEDLASEVSEHGKQRVTAEWFGHVVCWLGPFDSKMLDRIASLCSKPWFHGHLSSAQATRLLDGRSDGFFLVRFSSTEPGFFTISKNSARKVSHIRIAHQPCSGKYSVGTPAHPRPSYTSIAELLEKEEHLHLGSPCPGSRFAGEPEVSGYVGVQGLTSSLVKSE